MPEESDWEFLSEHRAADSQFLSLWEILRSRDSGNHPWTPDLFDEHAKNFAVQLPSQLGQATPRAGSDHDEIVISCEHRDGRGTTNKDVAKITFFLPANKMKIFLSSSINSDSEWLMTLRDVCEQPLWYFIANKGLRKTCIFCTKKLVHQSALKVGYGRKCAEKRELHFDYDGPESKRERLDFDDEVDYKDYL